jgi:hypothetical protein
MSSLEELDPNPDPNERSPVKKLYQKLWTESDAKKNEKAKDKDNPWSLIYPKNTGK